jgi:hypothetical protein
LLLFVKKYYKNTTILLGMLFGKFAGKLWKIRTLGEAHVLVETLGW